MIELFQLGITGVINVIAGVSLLSAGLYLRRKAINAGKGTALGTVLAVWGGLWVIAAAIGLVLQYLSIQAIINHETPLLQAYSLYGFIVKLFFLVTSIIIPWVIVASYKE